MRVRFAVFVRGVFPGSLTVVPRSISLLGALVLPPNSLFGPGPLPRGIRTGGVVWCGVVTPVVTTPLPLSVLVLLCLGLSSSPRVWEILQKMYLIQYT